MFRFFYVISIFLHIGVLFSQSINDLQKLRSDYERLKNQNSTTNSESFDIDRSISPIMDEVLDFNKDFINTNKAKNSKYFGYNFFTERDSLVFFDNLPAPLDYILGPGDELIISLWGETQFRKNYTISKDGKIYDERVGLLNLSGKTLDDAKKYLKTQFGRNYSTLRSKPQTTYIDISIGEMRSINVNFVGSVKKPGIFSVHPFSNLILGLFYAGGIDSTGTLRSIQIIRNNEEYATFDLYDYLIKGKSSKDLRLRDNDIIVVPPRLSTIEIDSAVFRPGIYEAKPNETVADLIAFAGGTNFRSSSTISIERKIDDFDQQNVYLDISESKNVKIFDGDHIRVYQKPEFFRKVEIIGQVKSLIYTVFIRECHYCNY